MNTELYRIVKQIPGEVSAKEVLMSGISADEADYRFKPVFELKLIRDQRVAYHNELCTEVTDWCFNVTEKNSNDVMMNYSIELDN